MSTAMYPTRAPQVMGCSAQRQHRTFVVPGSAIALTIPQAAAIGRALQVHNVHINPTTTALVAKRVIELGGDWSTPSVMQVVCAFRNSLQEGVSA